MAETIAKLEAKGSGKKGRKERRREGAYPAFYSRGEEIFNAVSHIAGSGMGLIFWAVLAALSHGAREVAAVSLFGFGAVVMYTMSALYHFLPSGTAKAVFRVFDHCTIFLVIAGSYSPFCLIPLYGTAVGLSVFIAEWVIALAGVTMNAIAMNCRAVKAISMALYVAGGWLGAAFAVPLWPLVPLSCFILLFAGGFAYTFGIAFFAFGRKRKWFHAVWHLFVLSGTALHFASILLLL